MFALLRRCFAFLPPQSESDRGRLTVLLDLDETLVYTFSPREESGYQYKPDIQEDVFLEYPEKKSQIFVYKRPHLDSFLSFLDEHYEPILWATGEQQYVDKVMNAIDPTNIIRHRLYQQHCTYDRAWKYPQFEFLKDINLLGRDPSRVVVLDDDWQGMYYQPDNFVHLQKYEAFYDDSSLQEEIPKLLEQLKAVEDVRPFLRSKFMLKYTWASNEQFYELTQEDVEMAEYLCLADHNDYKRLKRRYDEIFKIKTKYIPDHKLW